MFVRVVAYDPAWKDAFRQEAGPVAEALGGNLIRLFHIGSTSVPGLEAKPVIDMLAVVASLSQADASRGAFETLGYTVMGEYGIQGRRYYPKGGDNRTHHIHLFRFDNVYAIERHLAFRDYLEAHEEVRRQYGALKMRLAALYPENIEGYMDGKDAFVKCKEQEALKWNWKIRKPAGL